ncbi:hypothetical protein CFP56_006681 [Quercus suber]|uniref:Uncharacterized protein n=1 Tax=Quercus suber TaxID=58331 RepID=A0AAW0L6Q2_QUESU
MQTEPRKTLLCSAVATRLTYSHCAMCFAALEWLTWHSILRFIMGAICVEPEFVSTSRYHYLIPRDKITLYVEGGEEPLAVEQPFGNKEVANDDDVVVLHEGGNVDAKEIFPNLDFWTSLPQRTQSLLASLVQKFRGPSQGHRSSYSPVNF